MIIYYFTHSFKIDIFFTADWMFHHKNLSIVNLGISLYD